ncbi:MAG: hypothetical protein GF364_18340 [Candidatus Lokiarchaeota archaeon]|nr:hypothetical protein [Candidatus Lokiarchaeota archaeon]
MLRILEIIATIFDAMPFNEVKPRILRAIIIESIVLIIICGISISLYFRYIRHPKKNEQTRYLAFTYMSWSGAILFSIIGKVLQYLYTYDINTTEVGIITNWNMSLFLVNIGILFHAEFGYVIFPPKNFKKTKIFLKSICIVVSIFILVYPRYWQGKQIPVVHSIKFGAVFLFLIVTSISFIQKSKRISSFTTSNFLWRKMKYLKFMHVFFILVFIFFLISTIYGSFTDIYYTWLYFSASICMVISALFGLLGTKPISDEQKRLAIEEQKKRKKILSMGEK